MRAVMVFHAAVSSCFAHPASEASLLSARDNHPCRLGTSLGRQSFDANYMARDPLLTAGQRGDQPWPVPQIAVGAALAGQNPEWQPKRGLSLARHAFPGQLRQKLRAPHIHPRMDLHPERELPGVL